MSSTSRNCPKCGGPIDAEAPQGLCPKCLLLQASIPTEAGKEGASKPVPPTLAELAAAFPQLEILELIGQGGMGFVFKARQSKIERLVALKILPQSLAADPAFAERFTREGRVLARLNHPNIVTIYDFGQANGYFYLLMEFVDGVNLRQAMRAGRLDEVVLQALEKEPARRYQRVSEVKTAVDTIVSGPQPPSTPPVATATRGPAPDRFWRRFAVVVLALIAIPVGLAVLGIVAA